MKPGNRRHGPPPKEEQDYSDNFVDNREIAVKAKKATEKLLCMQAFAQGFPPTNIDI